MGHMVGAISAVLMGMDRYEAKTHNTLAILYAAGSFSILLPYCNPVKGPGAKCKTLDF